MTADTLKPLRTLLVDNDNSFSHNLYHLITQVNGIPPVLIKNDEKNWQPSNLKNIDNIVISRNQATPSTRQWRQHRTPRDTPPPPEHRFPSAQLSPPPAPAA
ncbi:MAG: hypothetical protein NC112_00395 [Oxalobacter formigenes]|nr:hypothetical protein [Oxalobacter formigenes]